LQSACVLSRKSLATTIREVGVYLALPTRGFIVLPVELRTAFETCRKRTLTIAAIVGCILSIINEGDVIIHGNATGMTAVKICLNFVVPFIVSNLGVQAGTRTAEA
jgi:hypothetical protein